MMTSVALKLSPSLRRILIASLQGDVLVNNALISFKEFL